MVNQDQNLLQDSITSKFLSMATTTTTTSPPIKTPILSIAQRALRLSKTINFSPQTVNSLSPQLSKNAETPTKTASLPPLPLLRTSSSPVPSVSCIDDRPSSKRLKRMKEQMEQMSQWCHQVINESDEEEEPIAAAESNQEEENEDRSEESVWVEQKPGGGLIVHFKCPCGKGYGIVLSGNKCYYKLS